MIISSKIYLSILITRPCQLRRIKNTAKTSLRVERAAQRKSNFSNRQTRYDLLFKKSSRDIIWIEIRFSVWNLRVGTIYQLFVIDKVLWQILLIELLCSLRRLDTGKYVKIIGSWQEDSVKPELLVLDCCYASSRHAWTHNTKYNPAWERLCMHRVSRALHDMILTSDPQFACEVPLTG